MNFMHLMVYLRNAFPKAWDLKLVCPAVDGCVPECNVHIKRNLFLTVAHLNDYHKWSRDRIADWLDLTAAEHQLDLTMPTPEELPHLTW